MGGSLPPSFPPGGPAAAASFAQRRRDFLFVPPPVGPSLQGWVGASKGEEGRGSLTPLTGHTMEH